MSSYRIALMPGDGIGPEIAAEAVAVLERVAELYGHSLAFEELPVGGVSIEQHGVALTPGSLDRARAADAVLFGAVGDPRYDDPAAEVRPEQALLALRQGLGLFANLRPARVLDPLVAQSPLVPERVRGTDILVVRELTGGIYFGEPRRRWSEAGERRALDTMVYSEEEVARILRVAFGLARARRGLVTSVDKANVLATSRLWREVAREVAADYPDVTLEHMLVDACAMHLVSAPTRFDVIVTENMFGDILSDEAAEITGSLGLMPSASFGDGGGAGGAPGLYEPAHGSAPDIAGAGVANPVGMILSAAMLLRLSLGLPEAAAAVESAVEGAIAAGHRTADITRDGAPPLSTSEMGREIVRRIEAGDSAGGGR